MLLALVSGIRAEAVPGGRGLCPTCRGEVVAKCGEIVTPHWAHVSAIECDPWSEGESAWHSEWKMEWPVECREVGIGNHRADVATDTVVIEFQHSHLGAEEIRDREEHYEDHGKPVVWVWDASEAYADDRLTVTGVGLGGPHEHHDFHWSHARRSIAACQCPVYLDLGDGWLLQLRKVHNKERDPGDTRIGRWEPFCGWGHRVSREEFVKRHPPTTRRQPVVAGLLFS